MACVITAPIAVKAPVARYTGKRDHGELTAALHDERPGVRARALYELGRMGEQGALQNGNHETAFYMLEDPSAQVRAAAALALGNMGYYGAAFVDDLGARLESKAVDIEVKRAAARAVGKLGTLAASQAASLERCLEETAGAGTDRDVDLVAAVCVALGAVGATSALPRLLECLKAPEVEVVVAACNGIGHLAQGAPELVAQLDHQDASVRAAAAAALARAPSVALAAASPERLLARTVEALSDAELQVRMSAVSILSAISAEAAPYAPRIGELIDHQDPGVRAAAAAALGGIGGPAAIAELPRLERLLADHEEDKAANVLTIAGLQAKVPASYRKPACAAAASIAVLGTAAQRSASWVAEKLDSFDEELRVQCACALAGLGKAGAQYEDQVLALVDDPQPMVVAAACYSLGSMAEASKMASPTVASRVAERVKEKHPAVRGAAVGSLGRMGSEGAVYAEDIAKCLGDRVSYVRVQAVEALAGCGEIGQMYAGEVCRAMFDMDTKVRLAAIATMPRFGARGAAYAEEVASLMDDPAPEIRAACVRALGNLDAQAAVDYLPTLLQLAESDESDLVRDAVSEAAVAIRALEDRSSRPGKAIAGDSDDDDDEEALAELMDARAAARTRALPPPAVAEPDADKEPDYSDLE